MAAQPSGEFDAGGVLTSDPSCVAHIKFNGGEVDCFGLGQNKSLFHNTFTQSETGGSWSGWTSLGGEFKFKPECVSLDSAGNLACFAIDDSAGRADAGEMQSILRIGGTFGTTWTSMGGLWTTGPSCVKAPISGPAVIRCFGLGQDGTIYSASLQDPVNGPVVGLIMGSGVPMAERPDCVPAAHFSCFGRDGGKSAVFADFLWNGALLSSGSLHGVLESPLNCTPKRDGAFCTGRGQSPTYSGYGVWTNPVVGGNWINLGGITESTPSCLSQPGTNRMRCYVVGQNQRLFESNTRVTTTDAWPTVWNQVPFSSKALGEIDDTAEPRVGPMPECFLVTDMTAPTNQQLFQVSCVVRAVDGSTQLMLMPNL